MPTPSPDAPSPRMEAAPARGVSAIWLLPLLALAGALAIGWSTWSERGPTIEITFDDAGGVRAGETTLRHRDIEVGRVEDVRFTPDARKVVATVRVAPEIAPFLDADARFWVVRPRVSASGVSGLGTLLAGVHLEVSWDETRGAPARSFTGLAEAPLTAPNTPGLRLSLRAADGGSIGVGAPVFFKGVEVGRIESRRITEAADAVEFGVFVRAPHASRITSATRFWNASGFDVELGAQGARLRVASLASVIRGGVVFDTLAGRADAEPAASGDSFLLHPSEGAARDSLLDGDGGDAALVMVHFGGSVRGLSVGAPVEYRGIRVGAVETIALSLGDAGEAALSVTLSVQPRRLGVADRDAALSFLAERSTRGLRAQLESASLLTGALYVGLVETDDPPVPLDMAATPYPELASKPSNLAAFAASAEGVMERINALPVEAVLEAAAALVGALTDLATDPAVRALPADASQALQAVARLADDPALLAATGALSEIETTVAALRESGAIERLGETMTAARETMTVASAAAASIEQAAGRLPQLVAALTASARRADAALASFEVGSELNYEAIAALREVRDAARAISDLTAAVDRRPNSLILGR